MTSTQDAIGRLRAYVEAFPDADDEIVDRDQDFELTVGDLRTLLTALDGDEVVNRACEVFMAQIAKGGDGYEMPRLFIVRDAMRAAIAARARM